MKGKRLLCLLTALFMLVSLLPAGALRVSATGTNTRTVLVGLIDHLYNNLGDSFELHYWGSESGTGDVSLQYADIDSYEKDLGPNYWGTPQRFRLYLAQIPDNADGFKIWYPNPGDDHWFGSDGDAENNDRVFVFEYGGSYLAEYGSPVTSVGSFEDWMQLREDVSFGLDYANRTVTLTAGLVIGNDCIGDENHPFRGCFDGCGNALSVEISDPGCYAVAPFRCISDGAIIRNLNVDGNIVGGYHSAGLVGYAQNGTSSDPNVIDNCRVNVNVSGADYLGGVVGHSFWSDLVIRNTVFEGSISDGGNYCGGLQGWSDGNDLTVENCLFCGSYTGSGTFDPIGINYSGHSFTRAFYTAEPQYTSSEGTKASLTEPTDGFALLTDVLGIQLWICGDTQVTGFNDWYDDDGTAHAIVPVVSYDGALLTEGVDYSYTIDGQSLSSVTAKGCYELVITGMGDYSGSITRHIAVVPATLAGSGTQGDPWLISDGADWIRFALNVNSGIDYSGEYVLQTANLIASMKVGSKSEPFRGIYDGDRKGINADICDTQNQGTSLFGCIEGATLRNVIVCGRVEGEYHTAGLVGFTQGLNNRIENCRVSAEIVAPDYIGGIVGHAQDSELTMENCVFSGRLIGGSGGKGAILGWDDSGPKYFIDCFYICPPDQITSGLHMVDGLSHDWSLTRCYRTAEDCDQGALVYEALPTDLLCGKVSDFEGDEYFLPCEISGVAPVYNCGYSPVVLSPQVEFEGSVLTENTDYELHVLLEGVEIAMPLSDTYGSFALQIVGNDVACFGSVSIPFELGCITWSSEPDGNNPWAILHISGSGPMEDLGHYPYDGTARYDVPAAHMGDVTTVIIDVGVTAIGDNAFEGFPNLERATIPAGITRIGEYAFSASSGAFTELCLPGSLQTIRKGAFYGLWNVTDVYCGFYEPDWWDLVYSEQVDSFDNHLLYYYNYYGQPVNYHWAEAHNLILTPVVHGSAQLFADGQASGQAIDGQLVSVMIDADPGYGLDDIRTSYLDNGTPVVFSILPFTSFTMPYGLASGEDVTVTVSFRVVPYTISYLGVDNAVVTPPNPTSYDVETPSFTLTNPVRTGYTFDGWTLEGETQPALNVEIPQGSVGNRVYTAHWTAHNYTVHFEPNPPFPDSVIGGSMADQAFVYGTAQNLDSNRFTCLGYNFDHWIDNQGAVYSDGQNVSNLTPVDGEIFELYAKWAPIHYTICFDPNGGSGGPMGTLTGVEYDAPIFLFQNIYARNGYNFAGWNTAQDGTGTHYGDEEEVRNLTSVDGNTVTLFAEWEPIHYTVQYDANGGGGGPMPDKVFTYGVQEALDPNLFTTPQQGYRFTGWRLNDPVNGLLVSENYDDSMLSIADNDVVTLYAQWTPIDYFVFFLPNGGTGTMTPGYAILSYDGPLFTFPACGYTPQVGYTFSHWNDEPDNSGLRSYTPGQQDNNLTTVHNDELYFYAQWTGIQYYIAFDPNGGTGPTMPNQTLTYGQSATLRQNTYTAQPGYSFDVWLDDNNTPWQDEDSVLNLTTVAGTTITMHAQWKANSYTVVYEAGAPAAYTGSTASQSFVYGTAGSVSACGFNCPGYVFRYWEDVDRGTIYNPSDPINVPVLNDGDVVTLRAHWDPITYTVQFDPNGATGGSMAPVTYTYGQPHAAPSCAFIYGQYYTFAGWGTSPNSGVVYIVNDPIPDLTTVNGDVVTLYAIWDPEPLTIIFHANDGSGATRTQIVYYGIQAQLEHNVFSYLEHHFTGWNDQPGGGGTPYNDEDYFTYLTQSGPTYDLYAQWTDSSYTVQFIANSPTTSSGSMQDQTFTYNQVGVFNACGYSVPGYDFDGWYRDPYGQNGPVSYAYNLSQVDGDIVYLYAQWAARSYYVDYIGNGATGGTMSTQRHVYDQWMGLDRNLYTKTGYSFRCWTDNADGSGNSYADEIAVNFCPSYDGEIIPIYAQWDPISFNISTSVEGPGELLFEQQSYHMGETVLFKAASQEGYLLDTISAVYYDVEEMPVALPIEQLREENAWRFVMPAGDVTVTAVFVDQGKHFSDVPANAWFAGPVSWALENGITTGTSDTTFSPGSSCTRAQVVTFLWRACGSPAPTVTQSPFLDVKNPSAWYYNAVLWAWENGITAGVSAQSFGVRQNCTRAQVVTFLWRMAGTPSSTQSGTGFDDVPADSWYANAVRWAVEVGITTGTGTGFSPNQVCTRAETVTFLYRYFTTD